MAKIKLENFRLFVEPFIRLKCKVNKETGCLEWQDAKNKQGYGIVKHRFLGDGWAQPHRVMYTLFKGEIPDDGVIMHACDNPCCCNPAHLSCGTSKLNTQDMLAKDRQHSKLKRKQVIEIKELIAKRDLSLPEIAKLYNVSRSTINLIRMGRVWKHIPDYKLIPDDCED